jgi:hypothetical protein
MRKHVLPRLFAFFDLKRDGAWDCEEFLCTAAFFRNSALEDKCKSNIMIVY